MPKTNIGNPSRDPEEAKLKTTFKQKLVTSLKWLFARSLSTHEQNESRLKCMVDGSLEALIESLEGGYLATLITLMARQISDCSPEQQACSQTIITAANFTGLGTAVADTIANLAIDNSKITPKTKEHIKEYFSMVRQIASNTAFFLALESFIGTAIIRQIQHLPPNEEVDVDDGTYIIIFCTSLLAAVATNPIIRNKIKQAIKRCGNERGIGTKLSDTVSEIVVQYATARETSLSILETIDAIFHTATEESLAGTIARHTFSAVRALVAAPYAFWGAPEINDHSLSRFEHGLDYLDKSLVVFYLAMALYENLNEGNTSVVVSLLVLQFLLLAFKESLVIYSVMCKRPTAEKDDALASSEPLTTPLLPGAAITTYA